MSDLENLRAEHAAVGYAQRLTIIIDVFIQSLYCYVISDTLLGEADESGEGKLPAHRRWNRLDEYFVPGVQIAEGEAVKVGEKFGLRITSITLPAERFKRADA